MQVVTEEAQVVYDKKNPFDGRVIERRMLTGEGSSKEVLHVTVDVEGSGFGFEPGDSLGIYAENDPREVVELLGLCGFSGDETVEVGKAKEVMSLRDALMRKLALMGVTRKFMEGVGERFEDEELVYLLSDAGKEALKEYLDGRGYIDVLERFPAVFKAQELVDYMRVLQPRLYSVASSPKVNACRVDLTVGVVRYALYDRERSGVATTYLADRVGDGVLPMFLAKSHFRMPEKDDVAMIMVGPGTGVAPFRAFMQEHIVRGRTGSTWLFFGDRNREMDYLYGEEFERYEQGGELTRLSLAFSRDQEEKVYVQDRMWESREALWEWIEGGAYFYVCGDMKRMAKDVDAMLHRIASEVGGMDEAGAKAYVKQMKRDKRYQRDVY